MQDIWNNPKYQDVRYEDGIPYYDPEVDSYRINEIGRSYIIVPEMLDDKKHMDIIESITEPGTAYYEEYMKLRNYLDELIQLEKENSGNIFCPPPLPRTA